MQMLSQCRICTLPLICERLGRKARKRGVEVIDVDVDPICLGEMERLH